MSQIEKNIKRVSDLRPGDFRRYPIWSWYEDDWDESRVIPVEITHPLDEEEYTAFFILCEFVLNDGTKIQGDISISLNNRFIYHLEFFKGNEKFGFSGKLHPKFGNLEQLSNWLKKSVDEITPLKYSTLYFFKDGTPIKGEIDLRDW
ncbi:MAG: hypothetical protein AB1801_01410 [Chloroflexota bacterium]